MTGKKHDDDDEAKETEKKHADVTKQAPDPHGKPATGGDPHPDPMGQPPDTPPAPSTMPEPEKK